MCDLDACPWACMLTGTSSRVFGLWTQVFPAAVKGKDEDGGRDASPHRPCWSSKGLKGCKGRGDSS